MNKEVEGFINHFVNYHEGIQNSLEKQFANGFCYHFALMLKNLFNRGEIVWAAPYGHIMWKDEDETPYDIYGANGSEYDYLIPIEYLGKYIDNFTHLPSKTKGITKKQLNNIINKYKKDFNID